MEDDEGHALPGPDLQAGGAQEVERRNEVRSPLGDRAMLIFGQSALDCTVLDVSTSGAKVRVSAAAVVPKQLILQFQLGNAFAARRLWVIGDQIGLLFDTSAPLIMGSAPVAAAALEALPANALEGCLRILRAAGFLNNFALTEAAREAEVAHVRFRTMLAGLVSRGS